MIPQLRFLTGAPSPASAGWDTIRTIPEVTDVVASNITLEMSGIPVDLVTDAINAVRQTAIATVWLGFLSMAPGNPQIIGDPVQVFQGALDVPTITEGAATCAIAITCENPLIDLNRAPQPRFTDVDQQVDYPGDTGFFQVQLLQDYLVLWPSPYQSNPNQTQPQPNFLTIQPGQSGPIAIAVGETVQLVATVTYSDGTTQIVMGPAVLRGWGCSGVFKRSEHRSAREWRDGKRRRNCDGTETGHVRGDGTLRVRSVFWQRSDQPTTPSDRFRHHHRDGSGLAARLPALNLNADMVGASIRIETGMVRVRCVSAFTRTGKTISNGPSLSAEP